MSEENLEKAEKKAEKKKKKRAEKYQKELKKLQIELLKLQRDVKANGKKILIIMEGRDAAGKGGTIKRITQNMNPRGCRAMALPKPSDVETTQWYFQRYVANLPSGGEIVIFDRSWYNRAMVEPVMGFCKPEQTERFLSDVVELEELLERGGIQIFKFFLSIDKTTQEKRFQKRQTDPLKSYKLSDVDKKSQSLWHEYNVAQKAMLERTSSEKHPWIVVDANNKPKTHINVIKFILSHCEYEGKIENEQLQPSNKIIRTAEDEISFLSGEIERHELGYQS